MSVNGRLFVGDRHQFGAMRSRRKTLSPGDLPPVHLSLEDQDALRVLADDLEREVVDVYEEFLFDHHRQVDTLRWKQLKSQEDLRVYCERDINMRSINRLQPFFPSGQTVKRELGPQGTLAAQTRVPLKMVSGTVAGTLDDAMYGGTIHDTASIRMRAEYQKEVMQNSAVLNVIDEATEEDPFQFLGVVWYLKSVGIPGITDRDMLMLSHIHTTQMSNGERIGVHLYHSIQLPSFPPRPGVIRMNASLVIVFRQLDERAVDVFILDVVDPMGNTLTILNTQESAKTLLASGHSCSTGVNKKLYWCMREKQRKQRALSGGGGMPIELDEATSKNCCVCAKSARGFFGSSGSLCHLCRQRTCSKCVVTRQIIISAEEDEPVEARAFDFCRLCLMDVKNRSTFDIARAEMLERRLVREYRAMSDRPVSDTATSSSTSGGNARSPFVGVLKACVDE